MKNKYLLEKNILNQERDLLINKALKLAMELHTGQKPRTDGPYWQHILRVNVIIEQELEIKDQEIIIAGILHDTIEDQLSKILDLYCHDDKNFSDRKRALKYFEKEFGQRVARILDGVTNLEVLDILDNHKERNLEYVKHIEEVIADPDVFLVKLADFMDNGLKIGGVEDRKRRFNLARKYLPVYGLFQGRIMDDDIKLSDEIKQKIVGRLSEAEKTARDVVTNYSNWQEIK